MKKNTDKKIDGILKSLRNLRNQRNTLSEEYDHQLTRTMVDYIDKLQDRFEAYVAVGRLRGIRNRARRGNGNKAHRKRIHKWAFARITNMLEYKLALIGLKNRFSVVDEKWTSKTCWKCNNKGERPRQPYFVCIDDKCLWHGDADFNGAINISKKLIKEFRLTNPKDWGVRGLGRYLPVVSVNTGTRQSKNLPKIRKGSPITLSKGNGNAGTDRQSSLIEFDHYDLPVEKDMEILSPEKSVDGGVGRKHVFARKEVLVTRKRMATSNKDC